MLYNTDIISFIRRLNASKYQPFSSRLVLSVEVYYTLYLYVETPNKIGEVDPSITKIMNLNIPEINTAAGEEFFEQ